MSIKENRLDETLSDFPQTSPKFTAGCKPRHALWRAEGLAMLYGGL